MERYAIIGFGCAGCHGARALREHGFTGEIHVYTDTGMAPENPMLTTYVTGGKIPEEAAYPFGTLEELEATLRLSIHAQRVTRVEPRTRTVATTQGDEAKYDKLLLCTGAHAFVPPMEGDKSPHVFTMRTMRDARRLRDRLERGDVRSAVVVGASMVGIKVIELLHQRKIACTLSDMAPHIFPLSAFDSISEEIERRLERAGVGLAFGRGITGLQEQEDGITVCFTDGSRQVCDLAVLCIGTRPSLDYLTPETLETGRGGIRVDTHMATSVPGVYAAGDCVESINIQDGQFQAVGLWANAGRQGDVAGAEMAGASDCYEGNLVHNITHFMGMDFISLGDKRLPGEHIVFAHRQGGLWLEATVGQGRLNCVNILDCERISGIVKGILIKQLRGERCADPLLMEKLRRQGVDEAFIKLVEGNDYD
ncbi:MAG TPA: FAD-dependent oxidoreductase [Candidatus Egerieimonas intestinavium]|uniref:FAD-dependent oxidoreductase n=1 Tax=Candidatus Egerieimonas intestinavium TaxID=2840777 RepID=A0A9D1EJL2_9FIRM|nr:FAD-dependent oxidoreductase [Candidatus Egerieimonas intestinavium]